VQSQFMAGALWGKAEALVAAFRGKASSRIVGFSQLRLDRSRLNFSLRTLVRYSFAGAETLSRS
jgi:hypothetical protein